MTLSGDTPPRPYSAEAEASVLGGILLSGRSAIEKTGELRPEMFRDAWNRVIYEACLSVAAENRETDIVTVYERINESGQTIKLEYLALLLDTVPTSANIAYHADIVRSRAAARRLMDIGEHLIAEAATGRINGTRDTAVAALAESLLSRTVTPLSWADMQATPPIQWQIADLLPVAGVGLIVGHPKAGKSTLARVLAATVAGHGGDSLFLGREVLRPGPVLYISPDEHPAMTASHFRDILPPDAKNVSFRTDQIPFGDALGLIEGGDYSLVVIDTLGRVVADAVNLDGEEYIAWQTALGGLRMAATKGDCTIVALHHARKSGGDRSLAVLGSTAIAGAADLILSLTIDQDPDGGWVRYIESTQRAGVELARQKIALAGDGWMTTREPIDAERDAKAEVRIMHAEGMSFGEIAEAMGISKSKAYRWVK